MRVRKNPSTAALSGIWMILITTFVIAVLYVGRPVLVPLTLAALLTFLLARVVTRLERWIGRIAAILLVVAILFGVAAGAGWLLTRQVIVLAARLPEYQTNIESRLRSIRIPMSGRFGRFTHSWERLRDQLAGGSAPAAKPSEGGGGNETPATNSSLRAIKTPAQQAMPVEIVSSEANIPQLLQKIIGAILGPLGTGGLVLLLVIFMLFKREDLRGRIIRLIGQGHISETTRVMDDAGRRVARYLSMQFLVNSCYALLVGTGLYFIGVPAAALWGVFAGTMRFIPYVGPCIGAAAPLLLSVAVSDNWLTPVLTAALFLGLELGNSNVLEPWLYGASTGVSSFALIIAAVFWTWLWGPIGLLLSTPLTVCLSVMGRHIPKLEFIGVLLSEEEALAPHEECYHRLLALHLDDANRLAESFLKGNSLNALYDQMLAPIITAVELDVRRGALDLEEREAVQQGLIDMMEDLAALPPAIRNGEEETNTTPVPMPISRVLCLPARAYRDELAGLMLTQLLRLQHFSAENAPASLSGGELFEMVAKFDPDLLCISVVAPSTLIQARSLTAKMRAHFPATRIVVGLWGASDANDIGPRLQASGADDVVFSLTAATKEIAKFSCGLADEMSPAPIPENEDGRISALAALDVLDSEAEEAFDRITRKVARVLQVPIALITFIDRDRQWFKSHVGLPEDLATARCTPRALSVCGHVVANNETIVVEDIARDRRFANNPLLKERTLRFYAGVPLRANELAVGSLCVLDLKPRKLSESEHRFLESMAEEVIEELAKRFPVANSHPQRVAHG